MGRRPRAGGGAQRYIDDGNNCRRAWDVDARNGPLPSAAQMEAWFPKPFSADTQNLLPSHRRCGPTTRHWRLRHDVRPQTAAWIQDDGESPRR